MNKEILLQCTDLGVRFGGVKALDGVNLKLRKGELRCLIGPNGAGKTTLFKCLTGTQRPSSGRVEFRGIDTVGMQRFAIARAGVGIKTQIPNLFEKLTVRENVWLGLRGYGNERERSQRTDQTLERVGVAPLARRVVGELAHGQRQLVELAMVIARRPELVLLDEPAAGMTGEEVERLAQIILDITREHSVVVVEHDMQFIRMIGGQVTVLHQGRVLAEDTVSEILRNPVVRDVYLGRSHEA
jgi:branched-chain amino acid transport system ATP-binding protein